MQYFPVAEAASNVSPFGRQIKVPAPPSCTASVAEPSVYTCIHVACGQKPSMCESVRSFLDVSSWSLVTVGIVVLIVRLLLVRSDDMGGLE